MKKLIFNWIFAIFIIFILSVNNYCQDGASIIGVGYSPHFKINQKQFFRKSFTGAHLFGEKVSEGFAFKLNIMFGLKNELEIVSKNDTISSFGGFSLSVGKSINPGKRIQLVGYVHFLDVLMIKRNSEFDIGIGIGPEAVLKFYITENFGFSTSLKGSIDFVQRKLNEEKYFSTFTYGYFINVIYSF